MVHYFLDYLYLLIGGKNGKFPFQAQTAVSDWLGNSNKERNVLIAPQVFILFGIINLLIVVSAY